MYTIECSAPAQRQTLVVIKGMHVAYGFDREVAHLWIFVYACCCLQSLHMQISLALLDLGCS